MNKAQAPEMKSLNAAQLAELLVGLRPLLPDWMYEQVAGLLQTLPWVLGIIEQKKTTIWNRSGRNSSGWRRAESFFITMTPRCGCRA